MAILHHAVATSSVVVASASVPKGAKQPAQKPTSQVVPDSVPVLRPASALAASLVALASPAAFAVNYDDFVNKASSSVPSASELSFPELPSVDLGGATDFVGANPFVVVAGLVAVAIPFVASRALASSGASSGSVSAVEAYSKLSDPELNAQLLDIRAAEDVKAEGSPNLKSIKKSVLKVSYAADDAAFVDKVLSKCKAAEDTTLYILDRFDGSSATVAKLLANSGFKSAYAIKGGAEGSNGWNEKGLPWATPPKALKLDLGNLKNLVGNVEGVDVNSSSLVPTTLGVAAAAGVGLVVLSEAETTLQLLGTVALVQLFVKKLLYAEDRKKTIEDLKSFLNTKIAPKDLIDDVKEVGRALLPTDSQVTAAIQTGEEVLKEKLEVESVTPEALAEKAKSKIEGVVEKAEDKIKEEAGKRGVELPDLEEVKSNLPDLEEVKSNLPDLEEVESNLPDLEEVKSNLPDLEEVKSNLQTKIQPSEEKEESSKSSANPASGSSAAAPLPVLQEPPSLTPKAEQEPEVETPEEKVESSNGSADPSSGSTPATTPLPVLQEPSSLTPKAEQESVIETPEEKEESSDSSADPASGSTPAAAPLPVLQEPPSLTPKAEQEPVVETLAVEPRTDTEVKPFFESDADLKPASPFEPVASAVSSAETSESAAAAFEGDEPPAFEEPGANESITAKELEVSASSRSGDSSS